MSTPVEPVVFPGTRPWSESARGVVGFVGVNAIGLGYILTLLPEAFRAQGDRVMPLGLAIAAMGAVAVAVSVGLVPPRHGRPLVLGGTALLLGASATMLVVLPASARSLAMGASMAFAGLTVLALAMRPDLIRRATPVETLAATQFIGMGLVSQLTIGPAGVAAPAAALIGAAQVACGIGLFVLPRGRIRSAVTALSIATLLALGAVVIGAGSVPGAVVVITLAGAVARDAYRMDVTTSLAALALLASAFEVLSWTSGLTALTLPAAPWVAASNVTDAVSAGGAAVLLLFGRYLRGRAAALVVALTVAVIAGDVAIQPEYERKEHVFTALLLTLAVITLPARQRGDPRALLAAASLGGVIVMLGLLDVLERALGLRDVHLEPLGEVHAGVGVTWALIGAASAISSWGAIRERSIRFRSISALVFFAVTFVGLITVTNAVTGWYLAVPADPSHAGEARRIGTGLLLAYLGAVSWLVIALSRAVSQPLDAMVSALRTYGEGDRSVRISATGDDEITAIARTFNAVADDLAVSERMRAMADARFRERVMYDELTGLGTIVLLRDAVDRLTSSGGHSGAGFSLVMGEVPAVEELIAAFGQEVGDAVVVGLAGRMRAIARPDDTLARTSALRFGLVAPGLGEREGLALAEAVRAALERPVTALGHEFQSAASVGVVTYPLAAERAPGVWSAALSALAAARRQEGGVVQFASTMSDEARERFSLVADLRAAIAGGQLRVLYQPELGLRSGRVEGVEALVRWAHPERGLLEPAAFVPVAERDGTIRHVDLAVLRMALEQVAKWSATGVRVPLAVNMSGRTVSDDRTAGLVLAALAEADVAAPLLTIEITEQALLSDIDAAQHTIARLRRAGVRASIDDFGSGHASFAYLRDLPVDDVKIDRAFVMGLTRRSDDAAIVRAIIALSHDLGRRVVAEGVDDQETLRALKHAGCDQVQGYLIGRPVDADEVIKLIRDVPAEPPEHKARVLVVDDHAPTTQLIERVLVEDGYAVHAAGTIEEARSELFRARFGVALLDIVLPDGSGLDLARWIRVRWPRTRILIVSASDPAQVSLELERYLHVRKPFEASELRAAVQAVVA